MLDDTLLVLFAAHAVDVQRARVLRRLLYGLVEEAEWRALLRSRHYLTSVCLDTPSRSAWATLYTHGSDINFINKMSLKRSVHE